MAKNNLPTNYADDIMNSTMGGKRRYRQIQNSDGTISLEDVTKYDRVGSDFGAGNINATNTAVNESADKNRIIDNLEAISSNTQSGYMAGALAVKKLNSNLIWKLLKSVNGSIPIMLPGQYSELCIMIFNSDSSQGVQFNIPRIAITSNYKRLMSGSAVSSGNGIDICAYIGFNIEQLSLVNFILNGTIITNNCSVHVYYR